MQGFKVVNQTIFSPTAKSCWDLNGNSAKAMGEQQLLVYISYETHPFYLLCKQPLALYLIHTPPLQPTTS